MSWQPHHPRVDTQALRSNFLPSPSVASHTKALARAEKSDLENLEDTIKHVQDTLRELQNRRDTLRQEVQRRESWLAPIRRLPVEVLQEVFANACLGNGRTGFSLAITSEVEDDYCESCESPECRHCEPPKLWKNTVTTLFSLSQVCSHWRSIAIGTPSLWASLWLDVNGMDEEHADLVDLYLQRSAQYPLKIALVEGDGDGYDIGETGCDMLHSVVQQLYRCREFHYKADTYNLINLIDEPFRPQALPLLTTFSDQVDADSHVDQWLWDLIKVAPNLVNVSVEWFTRLDRFPKSLRNLTIKGQRDNISFVQTIPQLPNLVSLNLDDFSPWEIDVRGILFSSVSLPFLSSLDISTDGPTVYDPVIGDLGALRALIKRSGCSLKELTLDVEPYSSGALISLLELQPSLVWLKLKVRVPPKASPADLELSPEQLVLADLFTRMTLPEPQSPLIPRVRHLDICEMAYATNYDYDVNERFKIVESALDMVESRVGCRESVADSDISLALAFDQIRVHRRYCLPVDLAKRVEGLNARGVKCRVSLPLVP
ncbi:hypothetical protein VNI00_002126 [Paramarasmius palmivorus]|uniref:F-box domain-containing protein n=1 Tax=Paramarasmius palmivorus TaxID=297713 RepID=A0AAW0E3V5_9AGAR